MALNPNNPIVNDPMLYVNELQLLYGSATTVDVLPGACRDSTDVNDIILPFPIAISTAFVGPNGLDQGVIQSRKIYSVYLIGDSAGYNQTAGLLYFPFGGPLEIPQGYDMFRRIGWIATDPSAEIIKFYQYGKEETRQYYYDSNQTVAILDGSATVFSVRDFDPFVPPIATEVFCKVEYTQMSTGTTAQYSPAGATSLVGIVQLGVGVVSVQSYSVTIPCQLSLAGFPAIKYKVGAGEKTSVIIEGYKDYLF